MTQLTSRPLIARPTVVALLAPILACQSLIDLGDEPRLRRDDSIEASEAAGGGAEGGASGIEEPALVCGVLAAPNPVCSECLETNCCSQSEACAADEQCTMALGCLQLCYEANCITDCLEQWNNESLDAYFQCNLQVCAIDCSVIDDCFTLADSCCTNIEDSIVRAGCMTVAHSADQAACRTAMTNSFVDTCEGSTSG